MHNNYTVQHYTFTTGFIWFYFRDWPVLGFVVVWWDGVYDDPKDPKGPFDARNRGRLWWLRPLRPSLSLLTHCFWTGFGHFRAWVSTVTSDIFKNAALFARNRFVLQVRGILNMNMSWLNSFGWTWTKLRYSKNKLIAILQPDQHDF